MTNEQCVHIIDDDPGARESLKLLIADSGYEVHCYSGAESFLAGESHKPGCALVDMRLEGMDGIELQRRLISDNVPVQVIMLSAYGDVQNAVRAMRLGAVDFIEKPYDPNQLLSRVNAAMNNSRDSEAAQRDARQHAALIDTLTPREKQVLKLLVEGLPNKRVAGELGISSRTVETHRVHIMQKLDADSLPHMVRIWLNASPHLDETEA